MPDYGDPDDAPVKISSCMRASGLFRNGCTIARMTKDQRRYRLTVRTEPSQGLNTGSIPVSATNITI